MKRLPACLLLILALLLPFPARARGSAAFTVQAVSGLDGGVELQIHYDGSLGKIGALSVNAGFDPGRFSFLEAESTSGISSSGVDNGQVNWVCTMSPGLGPGRVVTLRFQLSEDAGAGTAAFRLRVTEILSSGAEDLGNTVLDQTVNVQVEAPPAPELSVLVPSTGDLEPAFSPQVTHYRLTVPFSVSSLTFETAASPEATVRVNRKNLGAGGSYTDFLVTVSVGSQKTVYTVTAYRQP